MNILGLEASTSSAKAIIYSSKDGIIGMQDRPYHENISNIVTQDAEGVYKALLECGKSLVESFEGDIHAIALSSTWHSLLFIDKNGQPIGRTLTWANDIASKTVAKYRKDTSLVEFIYQRTGCPTHTTFPLWKWINARDEGILGDKSVLLSSQPEYIFWAMTGERGVSKSVASGTGFMNIHTLEWDEEILEFAGISIDQLAPLREPEYNAPLLGDVAEVLGVSAGIPVVITGPDGGLNQVGAGALGDGIMTMSVGTSGAVRMATDIPILPKEPSTWCYYVAEGKRLVGGATSGAGNCVNWFVKGLNGGIYSYDDLEEMMAQERLFDAPIFLPFLYGERSPGWGDDRAGGFEGLKGTHGLGDLYYSILEGILFNLYQCYNILKDLGSLPLEIRISGGIDKSSRWLQMAADIFQKEIYSFDLEHSSIMGAIVIGLKVLGEINSLQEFHLKPRKITKPNRGKIEFYEHRYDRYKKWYKKTGNRSENNN